MAETEAQTEPAQRTPAGTTEVVAQVFSIAGVHLCDIFANERALTVSNLKDLIAERTGIPAQEQKLLLGAVVLEDVSATPLQSAALGSSLSVVRVDGFQWGKHEEHGGSIEGCIWKKIKNNPDYSLVLSRTTYDVGVHTFCFKKVSGSEDGAYFGVCEANMLLKKPARTKQEAYSAFYRDYGCLSTCGLQGANDLVFGLANITPCDSELEMTYDCTARTLSFVINGKLQGTVTDVPETARHVFIQLDFVNNSWELVSHNGHGCGAA